MLPPADVPPTRKPLVGSAPRVDAFSAAFAVSAGGHLNDHILYKMIMLTHFVASQQSLCAVGNTYSGASL